MQMNLFLKLQSPVESEDKQDTRLEPKIPAC
jgi:hypothetical protein